MASSSALVTLPIDLKPNPNPLPYGRLPLRAGAWDQLQARRAYEESDEHPQPAPAALDRRI
jgi:hypothetical protein